MPGEAGGDREKRKSVRLAASLLLGQGREVPVTIVDMTCNGCKIATPLVLFKDDKLKLSVPKLCVLDVEVRWNKQDHAGLRFLPPEKETAEHGSKDRLKVSTQISLRRMARQHYQARVFDLSPTGCKVEFVERPRVGEQVWAKFDGLDSMEATVRWVDGFYGGIQFCRPIHAAVFDILRDKLAQRTGCDLPR